MSVIWQLVKVIIVLFFIAWVANCAGAVVSEILDMAKEVKEL